MDRKLAVIAGTHVDIRLGMEYLRGRGLPLELHDYAVSATCTEQHAFQYGDPAARALRIREIFQDAESKGVRDFFIYCNSLSGAFDFETLAAERGVRVITPLMVYRALGTRYHTVGLIAANQLSVYRIEQNLVTHNPGLDVLGLGINPVVRAVEQGLPPTGIVSEFGLDMLAAWYTARRAECLILGCTHFPYFKEALASHTQLPLIDPADEMVGMLGIET